MGLLETSVKPTWMTRDWSIQVNISRLNTGNWVCFSSPSPFNATAEEALQAIEDMKRRLLSMCVSNVAVTPLVCYERRAGDVACDNVVARYNEFDAKGNSIHPARQFTAVVDEVIIPVEVLRSSIVRLQLIKEIK